MWSAFDGCCAQGYLPAPREGPPSRSGGHVRGFLVVPGFLALALALAALDEESGIRPWLHLRAELADSRARIEKLRSETEALRQQAERLESDSFAQEAAIREELELARPGQSLVRLRGDNSQVPDFFDEIQTPRDPLVR